MQLFLLIVLFDSMQKCYTEVCVIKLFSVHTFLFVIPQPSQTRKRKLLITGRDCISYLTVSCGAGQGGGRPGEKGAGGVREAGEEGAGSGIPKVAGSGRKREKLCNIAKYFAIEKMQRVGAKKYRAGTGIKGYGKREVQTPLSPPPILLISCVSQNFTDHANRKKFVETFIHDPARASFGSPCL